MTFKEFIHKFLEVYLDNWKMFGLVKRHVASLHLMLDTCQTYQIMLNLKKCLFYVPFEILLGHVVCRQGMMLGHVDNQHGGAEEYEIATRKSRAYQIL